MAYPAHEADLALARIDELKARLAESQKALYDLAPRIERLEQRIDTLEASLARADAIAKRLADGIRPS